MFSPRIVRFRAAMILALAVLFSSDAALASFVCPHMSGCEHGMPAPSSVNVSDESPTGEGEPCCPVQSETTMECAASAMECCAWHHSDSDVSAVLFASDHPSKQIVALPPAAVSHGPSLGAHAQLPDSADTLAFIKPVTQKKTDLRI